ncbi:tyrosine--tRNA ligase [Candidatus Pacearchaeota archaeon CG10_big_fil_rev_8_21_14_0_10_32_14]|nr:MAG: tyrosine--tRNA ligase [Candidatus Pacearchaeota archaeon CG10_big_fil_rev_8_21_14_0_10_32_14]
MVKKSLSVEEKFDLIKRNTEEIIQEDELKALLSNGEKLKHYIGFEISGKPHLGHGLVCMSKVKDFVDAGIDCSIFLADWHSWINDKLGGDMKVIQGIGVNYFKEALVAAYKCVGGNPKDLKFVLGSELYHNNDKYWEMVIDVSKNITLGRIERSITIMGRKEGESVDFAKLIYPPMQVADIFIQKINIAHAGNDQRKAQVIARDVALKLKNPMKNKKGETIKPIAIHGHLILGLQKPTVWPVQKENLQDLWGQMKMSKSVPSSAIYMTDSEDEVKKKISNAFCPEGEIDFNPLIDWAKYIIFINDKSVLNITRSDKFGGNVSYHSIETLKKDFAEKKLHPMDLKNAMAEKINQILDPAREHFAQPKIKKYKEEMDKLLITR